jgi:predicted transcriptional regulator
MTHTETITLRLPKDIRERLDKAATQTKRSRSDLIRQALEQQLGRILDEDYRREHRTKMERLLAMAGSGAKYSTYKSADEVIATIREFRGDD